jgi:hypothetical protein
MYLRGTALEYLETVLPPAVFAALARRLPAAVSPAPQRRPAAAVRAELLDAAATITVSRDEVRRHLAALDLDEMG